MDNKNEEYLNFEDENSTARSRRASHRRSTTRPTGLRKRQEMKEEQEQGLSIFSMPNITSLFSRSKPSSGNHPNLTDHKSQPRKSAHEPNTRPASSGSLDTTTEKKSNHARELSDLKKKVLELQDKLGQAEEQYRNTITQVLAKYEETLTDNDMLRLQIMSMRKPEGQVNNDGYYQRKLDELNERTKTWVAVAVKSAASRNLSEAGLRYLWKLLSQFPDVPRDECRLYAFFLHSALRNVFRPFCAGIPTHVSDMLKQVETRIYDKEPDFSKALMIRQAIGRGILEYYPKSQKPKIQPILEGALHLFGIKREDIHKQLETMFDEAIDLANLMTAEQASFKATIIQAGECFNAKYMQLPDSGQSGLVYLCTFPLFTKLTMENGKLDYAIFVRADVELESEF